MKLWMFKKKFFQEIYMVLINIVIIMHNKMIYLVMLIYNDLTLYFVTYDIYPIEYKIFSANKIYLIYQ